MTPPGAPWNLPVPRWLSLIAAFVLAVSACALAMSFLTPIYYDDIRFNLANGRAGYDGWRTISPVPYCKGHFATPLPLSLIPGRALAWAAHALTDSFIVMRAFAMALLLGWMAWMAWAAKRLTLADWPWLHVAALVAAFMGLGVVPLVMMQSRPDAGMALVVTIFATLPLLLRGRLSRVRAAVAAALLLGLASCFFSAHPRALFYAPLLLAGCWFLPAGQRVRLALCAGMLVMAMQGWQYWALKTQCPDYEKEQTMRSSQALTPGKVASVTEAYLDNMLRASPGLEKMFFESNDRLVAGEKPWWLQPGHIAVMIEVIMLVILPMIASGLIVAAVNVINTPVYVMRIFFTTENRWRLDMGSAAWMTLLDTAIALAALAAFVLVVREVARLLKQARILRVWDRPGPMLLLALALGILTQSAVQLTKNFYESSFMWPCLLLLLLLASAEAPWRTKIGRYGRGALLALLLLALASQIGLLAGYAPLLARELKQAGPGGQLDNALLLSPLGYESTRRQVEASARSCGIATDAGARHVMVDSVTYLAMRETWQPFFHPARWNDDEYDVKEKLFPFLHGQGSSGLIALCRHLPPDIRAAARSSDGICCVGRDALALPSGGEGE